MTPPPSIEAAAPLTGAPDLSGLAKLRRVAFVALVVLCAFDALSAVGGAVAIVATGGMGMPMSMLANGPFDSFFWPGVILGLVVGGTHLIAAVLLIRRRESAFFWASVAGFGLVVWIFVETAIIAGISWLQVIYFATGVAELALVLALLGVVRWMPRAPLSDGR